MIYSFDLIDSDAIYPEFLIEISKTSDFAFFGNTFLIVA
jgi:hypothetical protein